MSGSPAMAVDNSVLVPHIEDTEPKVDTEETYLRLLYSLMLRG